MYYADLQFMCMLVTKIALEKAVFGVCMSGLGIFVLLATQWKCGDFCFQNCWVVANKVILQAVEHNHP